MKKPSGYIIYRGPSLLDGKPIVVVAITKSSNRKTGNMVQTYILVDNGELPIANYQSLADSSICGDCKHRRGLGGACYVNVGQGPTQVLKGVLRNIYPKNKYAASRECAGRNVRLGTYGDPAAVPADVWRLLLAGAEGHTGYTHQWASGKAEHVREWCMASADSEQEREEARAQGWRTFRVRTAQESVLKGEFVCPASDEGNKRVHCSDCLACDGGTKVQKGSPCIIAHGSLKSRFRKFELAIAA
jgi:hypothetical protein